MDRPMSTALWQKKIDENKMFVVPKPLEIEELEKLLIDFGIAN